MRYIVGDWQDMAEETRAYVTSYTNSFLKRRYDAKMGAMEHHRNECRVCGGGQGLVCQHGVLLLVPRTRMTLWRLEKAGNFPQRINVTERYPVWAESEIRDWMANRPRGIQERAAK